MNADVTLQLGGVAPNVLRELSGVYPTFVSAFKELVSNAYDADATRVTIQFSSDLGLITVEDNGAGMTPFEFQDEYLRIGGSAQRQGTDWTAGGRRPVGRKGIGFLAVARYCRLVEIYSHTEREVVFCQDVAPSPQTGLLEKVIPFFPSPFAPAMAPFVTIRSVQCESCELGPGEYRQRGATIELSEEARQRCKGRMLTVRFRVDCRPIDLQATIDYDYLFNLEDDRNLEALQDFCRVRLVPRAEVTDSSFTRVVLHLHDFVRRALSASQRRGRVRNIASAGGLDRFLWRLSRSTPVAYDLSPQEIERHGLELLAVSPSPTPFAIQVRLPNDGTRELTRPLLDDINGIALDDPALVRQPVRIEAEGLAAQGYLLGFPQSIFPAELRGIAVRVRGVEIGQPGFLGIEHDLPVKYRSFLNQVMGEIIVTEGLDALRAVMPGREGFYAENAQFQALRRHLVGDGAAELGALGQVLHKLREQRSVASSAARIVQETRRRKKAFLDVSDAITALAVGSPYGRALRRLFARSDVTASRLDQAPEYQVQLPGAIAGYTLELSDSMEGDHQLDPQRSVVRLRRDVGLWNSSLHILNRDFTISLRNGRVGDPVCEVDLSTDTIYLNWRHPTRGKMGDAMFIKSALFWRIAYLAAAGTPSTSSGQAMDLMMNLAHHLLSTTTD